MSHITFESASVEDEEESVYKYPKEGPPKKIGIIRLDDNYKARYIHLNISLLNKDQLEVIINEMKRIDELHG